jgi:hypothetical protein
LRIIESFEGILRPVVILAGSFALTAIVYTKSSIQLLAGFVQEGTFKHPSAEEYNSNVVLPWRLS